MPQAKQFTTDMYQGMLAETTTIEGDKGQIINAYFARPLGPGPFPAMVLIHHAPGWDEWYWEATRRFAHHGYMALCPNIYFRLGSGVPEDIAAKARTMGGVPDDQVVGDVEGARKFLASLPNCTGKVGVFGTCSGGRQAFLVACKTDGFSAAVDCWGGRVVMAPNELNSNNPVAPIEFTKDLSCPVLGVFGNDDQFPTPQQVNQQEEALKKSGKTYEFHRYDGAGHGFFYYDKAMYRQEQAVDGWKKVFAFLEKHLSSGSS
jgi:carboxymethylenebutenolidase